MNVQIFEMLTGRSLFRALEGANYSAEAYLLVHMAAYADEEYDQTCFREGTEYDRYFKDNGTHTNS